jgi:hypothetical protein
MSLSAAFTADGGVGETATAVTLDWCVPASRPQLASAMRSAMLGVEPEESCAQDAVQSHAFHHTEDPQTTGARADKTASTAVV